MVNLYIFSNNTDGDKMLSVIGNISMNMEQQDLTEESSGDEYFYKIDTVAAIIKLGSTNIQEFRNGF